MPVPLQTRDNCGAWSSLAQSMRGTARISAQPLLGSEAWILKECEHEQVPSEARLSSRRLA